MKQFLKILSGYPVFLLGCGGKADSSAALQTMQSQLGAIDAAVAGIGKLLGFCVTYAPFILIGALLIGLFVGAGIGSRNGR